MNVMKVYELFIVVNFLVMLIVVLRNWNPLSIEGSFLKSFYVFWSSVLFLVVLFAWVKNNVNWDFLTYQVF